MPVYSQNELSRIVQSQLSAYVTAGLSQTHVHSVMDLIRTCLPKEIVVTLPDRDYFPVLLVIPIQLLPFDALLSLISYTPAGDAEEGGKGFSYLDALAIQTRDLYERPPPQKAPYLIEAVEDGRRSLGRSSSEATERILNMGRYPLNLEQGLALAIFAPEIFRYHNIYLAGSLIKDGKTGERFTPDLWEVAGGVKLKRDLPNARDRRWGTPSFKEMLFQRSGTLY